MSAHTITARDVPELRADMVADSVDFSKKFPGHHPWYPSHEAADLFWVCKKMRDLGVEGANEMPEYVFEADDMPSPHGILVWEEAVQGAAGVAWKSYGNTIVLTVLVPKAKAIDMAVRATKNPKAREVLRKMPVRAQLWSEMEIPVPFGTTIKQGSYRIGTQYKDMEEDRLWAELIPRLLITLWGLMEQPLAGSEIVRPSKAGMKRLARMNPNLLTETRYITLRRIEVPKSEESGSGLDSGMHYSVRWVVRPHERWIDDKDNPGKKRKIKVRPHIKGPEGAPLLDPSKLVSVLRK
jgi:hypothetical protein